MTAITIIGLVFFAWLALALVIAPAVGRALARMARGYPRDGGR